MVRWRSGVYCPRCGSRRVQPVRMSGAVECDEVYVTAGLKGRNNSHRIKKLDKPAVFVLVERDGSEDYVPSGDVEAETVLKIIRRRVSEDSTIYTNCFKAYLGFRGGGIQTRGRQPPSW